MRSRRRALIQPAARGCGGEGEHACFRLGQDAAGDEFLELRAHALDVSRIGVVAQRLAHLLGA
jgi:hypothetical protein